MSSAIGSLVERRAAGGPARCRHRSPATQDLPGALDAAASFVPHVFDEHLVDLGEARMNYVLEGGADRPALCWSRPRPSPGATSTSPADEHLQHEPVVITDHKDACFVERAASAAVRPHGHGSPTSPTTTAAEGWYAARGATTGRRTPR
jgi:hypothetical protein